MREEQHQESSGLEMGLGIVSFSASLAINLRSLACVEP